MCEALEVARAVADLPEDEKFPAPGQHFDRIGSIELNGEPLAAGDGAAVSEEPVLNISSTSESNVLVFDLA